MSKETVLVKNKKTNDIYEHHGGTSYTNLTTQKQGDIPDELASKVFVVPVSLNSICNEYPNVLMLIEKFSLKLEETVPYYEPRSIPNQQKETVCQK